MSSEAVKKQILRAISALNLPLDRTPNGDKVDQACSAAKLLRNRILREYTRVVEHIEALQQNQLYDDENDETDEFFDTQKTDLGGEIRKLGRQDFLFMSEMRVMENIVVPLLLAHGMNCSSDLLLQLLKLLTSMLLPVPIHSLEEARQADYLSRLIKRCGTDEFFSLLIHCVAPIAEKRSSRSLQRYDVILLEIVLKIITLFFTGPKESTGSAIGAFCRNHGFELFLVVLNQNYAKYESKKNSGFEINEQAQDIGCDIVDSEESEETIELVHSNNKIESLELNEEVNVLTDTLHDMRTTQHKSIHNIVESPAVTQHSVNCSETDENDDDKEGGSECEEEDDVGDEDHDKRDEDDVKNGITERDDYGGTNLFNARMLELLESDEQLWRWNVHIITAMASVLRCANSMELAQLSFLSNFEELSPSFDVMGLLRTENRLRESKKESDRWRVIARRRNGAISSNGLLVRGTPSACREGNGGALGVASLLLPLRSKDPVEKGRDIDTRKKGRFVKGIHDDNVGLCNLPLPIKIQLSQQCLSFICYGFEPLNMMVWDRMTKTINSLQSTVTERIEFMAGLKNSDEDIEAPTQLDKSTLDMTKGVLDYISVCASLLRYTREIVRLSRENKNENSSAYFHQQWKCISGVITIDHIRYGLELLRIFLNFPELRKKYGITIIVTYLAELFMTINHLVDGDIVKDTSVVVAANALASTILYNEENISLVFEVISRSSVRPLSPAMTGILILLVYSVLRLMEKCSFRGNIVFPAKSMKVDIIEPDVEEPRPTELTCSDNEVVNDQSETFNASEEKGTEEPHVSTPLHAVALENIEVESAYTQNKRPVSVENISCASSGYGGFSTLSSEREVSLCNYFKRLGTTKNMGLILSSLRHWRINDSAVNTGLSYIINSLLAEGNGNVFFSAPFLIIMRDILTAGEESTGVLYDVCDRVVYEFFNPGFAKLLDEKKKAHLGESISVLRGAQSFLGFEVALRCARSLFAFNSTDYSILEEKGLPHLNDSIVIPINEEDNKDDSPPSLALSPQGELKKQTSRKRPRKDVHGELFHGEKREDVSIEDQIMEKNLE